jgi:hypothetical protein
VAAPDEAGLPGAVLVVEGLRIAGPENESAGRRVAHGSGVCEDIGHAGIRRKGFALLDADGGQQAEELRIEIIDRFLLEDRVDLLEECHVVGMDGVE